MAIAKKKGKDHTPLAWKSMQLGGELISQGIEGLIGIEELTNYTLSKKKSPFSSSVKITKARTKSKDVFVDKGFAQEKKTPTNTEENTSKGDEKKAVKREKKLLREKKRKEKKRELKLNAKNTKDTKKSDPSTSSDEVNSKTNDQNESSVSTTTTVSKNKIRNDQKKLRIKKKKEKNLKKKQKRQMKSSNPEDAGNPMAQTAEPSISNSPSENKKRKSSSSPGNEPVNKKKKSNVLGTESVKVSKNSKTKKKKSPKTPKVKLPETKKALLKRTETATDAVESGSLDDDSEAEENLSGAEGISTKPVRGMEGWSVLNLPDSILRALAEKGFKNPTEIQALSLPAAVLGRRDIMGAAETGSGKTLAFGIPILYGILQRKKKESMENAANELTSEEEEEDQDEEGENEEGEEGENELEDEEEEGGEDDNEVDEVTDTQYSNSDSDNDIEEMEEDDGEIGCVKVIDNADFSFMTDYANTAVVKPVNPKHNQKLYALILTPTRELAIQVKDHIAAAAKYTGIRVTVVIGGLAHQKQERLLKMKPEIVVATPGRLWELIQEGNSFLQQVDTISYLAIDETDRMIEKGHFLELQQLLLRINANEENKKRRQNFVFSATLTMVHEPPQRKKARGKKQQLRVTPGQKLQDVIKMLGIRQPKIVDVTQESGTARTLEEAQIRCTFEEKDIYLYYFLISRPGRTLIFCNSISCVRRLAQILTILKCKPLPIHANMVQRQRLKNLDRFRANPTGLLLATDVAARGLDIPDVEHVVHYQVPRTSEGYIHRSGRTARASKGGLTLLLIEPEEQQSFSRLCRTLGRANELPAFSVSQDLLSAAKERVQLARAIDRLELTTKRSDAEHGWYQKALADMDMVLDDSELPSRISEEDSAKNRRASSVKRKQLESLLSRPLFTRS